MIRKITLFVLMLVINSTLSIQNLTAQNQVLSLEGDGDYMNSNLLYSNSHKTYELWGKSNIDSDIRVILLGIHNPLVDGRFYFGFETGDGFLGLGLGNNGWNNESNGYLVDTNWHQYVLLWNEPNLELYLDGELIAQKSNTTSATDTYFIGAGHIWEPPWSDAYFNGLIDEVRIWNYTRTQEEIQADKYQTLMGNETGLIAYWNFDNGTANDLTVNGNNGTLMGNSQIVFEEIPFTGTTIYLNLFLEGPYNGNDMNTDLNPEPIPLFQPYNDPLKWDYQGTESVIAIPNADVVDWVLVELRETSGEASTALPDSMIAQQAAFILKDGSIVGLDGTSPLYFDNEITDYLYVVVHHRNHLPIMSSGPLTAVKGDYNWDFTTGMSQAYGVDAQVDLGGGVFGMIGGDGNSNGQIEYYDKDTIWTAEAGNAAYLFGDFTLDQQADNIDKNDIWEPNLDLKNQVPGNLCQPQPDVADAGLDIPYSCFGEATLSANSSQNGIGTWSVINGASGFFNDIHDPFTIFYGETGIDYTLKWTISTSCASTFDLINVYLEAEPDQANAGPDQIDVFGTLTVLEANTPTNGIGNWILLSGEGGSIDDPLDPNTNFQGIAGNSYELIWGIFNNCDYSEDLVIISFAPPIWSCGYDFIDERDGQIYNTAQIGSQCWMAENLNIGTRVDGINDQTDNSIIEKYCYDNIEDSCNTYGGLYQWNEMLQYSTIENAIGICPYGWHIPSDEEFKELEGTVDSQYGYPDPIWDIEGYRGFDLGLNLKSTTVWSGGSSNNTDSFGFTALPGGMRSYNGGVIFGWGSIVSFWSRTEKEYYSAWNREMHYLTNSVVGRYGATKNNGYSIRCLKTVNNQPPTEPSNTYPQNESTSIPIDTVLSWACFDPDGDELYYSVYFGTDNNPPLVLTDCLDTAYITGFLNYETTYFWRITAFDIYGDSSTSITWSFTSEIQPSWICGDTLIDDRDGKFYNTVQIGTQCWMAENLNIGIVINESNDQTDNGIIEKYCYYNNNSNCVAYGGLYQWDEMMEYNTVPSLQGICPSGWHLPSDSEWKIMEIFLGMTQEQADETWWRGVDEGGKLKEVGTNHWSSPNTGAINSSGFTGLPGGYRQSSGWFYHTTNHAFFWSSSDNGSYPWYRNLGYDKSQVNRDLEIQTCGMSVRCLKN